jgi:receptor-type tyrosine-protein phosphatase eta
VDRSYINASYIPGVHHVHEYIAAQGPLASTSAAFWQMVWESKSECIVMLTSVEEGGKKKCHPYWDATLDDPLCPLTPADMEISVSTECKCARNGKSASHPASSLPFVCRHIELKRDTASRVVHHYHFTGWLDRDTPDVTQLLAFRNHIRQQHPASAQASPLIVHCSAGIGRTGTFIAIDRIMFQLQQHETIDILATVADMRKHRMYMVQTVSQVSLKCAVLPRGI